MAKAKTRVRVATATNRAPNSRARLSTVTDHEIARRTYDLYVARGCEHGHDVDDWLQNARCTVGFPLPLLAA
jgi:Protein of unknown function (DUF2934)